MAGGEWPTLVAMATPASEPELIGADLAVVSVELWTDRVVVRTVRALTSEEEDPGGTVSALSDGGRRRRHDQRGGGGHGSPGIFRSWASLGGGATTNDCPLTVHVATGGKATEIVLEGDAFRPAVPIEARVHPAPDPSGRCGLCGAPATGRRDDRTPARARCQPCRALGRGAVAVTFSSRPSCIVPLGMTATALGWGAITLLALEHHTEATVLRYHHGHTWTQDGSPFGHALVATDDQGVVHHGRRTAGHGDDDGWTGEVAFVPPFDPEVRQIQFAARVAGTPILHLDITVPPTTETPLAATSH